MATLSDYKVPEMATIHLMVLLYSIPSHFNHVIFDLYWGYPARGCDYLDASCLLFSEKSFQCAVDYSKRSKGNAVQHSGDVMDNSRRLGHHTMHVRLQELPPNITHLYFTLSAWNSPTISHFPNPSLKFFEASNKTKDLCATNLRQQTHQSQAIIMCSVVRAGNHWKILQSGKLSAGNAKNYQPLINTIKQL